MPDDYLIFRPDDVDLSRSPLRRGVTEPTYVLGAFNPGLARLPNGNLLLMVRVAEALREPGIRRQFQRIDFAIFDPKPPHPALRAFEQAFQ